MEMKMHKMLLKKDKVAKASKEELGIFFSLLRQINSIRSWMKIQVKLKGDENQLPRSRAARYERFVNSSTQIT